MFLNPENLDPHQDQWAYLSAVGRMTPKEVSRAADQAGRVPAGSQAELADLIGVSAAAIGQYESAR